MHTLCGKILYTLSFITYFYWKQNYFWLQIHLNKGNTLLMSDYINLQLKQLFFLKAKKFKQGVHIA